MSAVCILWRICGAGLLPDIFPLVAKRLVDTDDHLLERDRSVAGADIKEAVNAGLEPLVDDEKVLRHIERLRGSAALDSARIDKARR